MREMGRPLGYEYSYGFSVEDEIIPLYPTQLCLVRNKDGQKKFLFEIRTNFKLKRRVFVDNDSHEYDMMMGSERFGAAVSEDQSEWWLEDQTSFRLQDYWMSPDEIQSLVREALDFAKQTAGAAHASRSVIPVVVGLDVWTVQREGEPINAPIHRAIRPGSLIPLNLWPVVPKESLEVHKSYLERESFLWNLDRMRVGDDNGGIALEKEFCAVCSGNFVSGAQVSYLPCAHACHSLCVFRLLDEIKRDSCPKCGFRIPTDWEKYESEASFVTDSDL